MDFSFWQCKDYADIRLVLLGMGVKRQWGGRKHWFSVLSIAILSQPLDMRPRSSYGNKQFLIGYLVTQNRWLWMTLNQWMAILRSRVKGIIRPCHLDVLSSKIFQGYIWHKQFGVSAEVCGLFHSWAKQQPRDVKQTTCNVLCSFLEELHNYK